MAKKLVGGPPKTRLSRSRVIGKTAAGAAGKKLASEVKAVFLSGDDLESHRAKTREEIAQLVFEGLTKLRGTALKLAQVFCSDTGLLPDEYLKTFEQSHYQVPSLSPALARSLLRRELKREPEEIFSHFDWTAAAAASLGQVHRARLHDGSPVAVKIQYPGMQESLVSDMALARLALKPLLRTGLIVSTLDQLEARLLEEVDYQRELANLEWFAGQKYPFSVLVPKPYPQHSSKRVLTMQWMEGVPIDQWARTVPSKAEVNRVAQVLFDLFVISVFERRRFHSDCNLGNFLVAPGGVVVVLDFGAVTEIPDRDAEFYRCLWEPDGQAERLVREYQERGAQTDGAFWDECVQPYLNWIGEVTNCGGTFDFGSRPQFVNDGFRLFSSQMFNSKLQNYSDHLTLAHRTLLGLFALFTRLQAQVQVSQFLKF